jgi:hypothetical protein
MIERMYVYSRLFGDLLGNEQFDDAEILREHQAATIRRLAGESVVLAARDTTSLNYDTHRKNGWAGTDVFSNFRVHNEPDLHCTDKP